MQLRALRRYLHTALLLALSALAAPLAATGQGSGFNPALPITHVDNGPNSAWAQSQHYLVLVSLDGFRWDYARRDNASHLLAIGKAGVWVPQGMLPSYPSLTFPNHYTLVTGLYPEHHGIVANNFLDPARSARYSMYDKKTINDGSWYGGVPLWSLAESQGMRTACLLSGRVRGQNCRLPSVLLRHLRWQNPGHARGPAGAHRQCSGAAPSARRRPSALHRHLLLRA